MDTFDSYRSNVPARLPVPRPGAPAIRSSSGLPEATAQSPLSIRVMIRGARRYWWLVLMLWVVGSAGIGAAIYLKVRPSYRALSLLRVEPAANDLYNVRTNGETFEPFLQTLVQLITSPNVLTAAGTNPKAAVLGRIQTAGDVVQELRKVVNVNVLPGTYLIEVSMTSHDPYESTVIVNAVVDAFMEANSEWSDGMTRGQIKNLETYQRDLQNQTDELERRWKELVARGDLDNRAVEDSKKENANKAEEQGPSRSSITIEEFKKVRQDLFAVNLELTQAQAWLSTAKVAATKFSKGPSSPKEDEARLEQQIVRRFKADPEVADLAGQVMAARNKVEEVQRIANQAGDPAERAAEKKLKTLTTRYNQLWATKSQ